MRWLLRIIGFVLVACLIAVGGLLLLPGERIAKIAADQVKSQTGRELAFTGGVDVTLWPVLGIETGPVAISNADWAGDQPMFTAESLSIGISAPDLLKGAIRIQRVVAAAPRLRLVTAADGRNNWDIAATSADGGGTGGSVGESAPSTPLTIELVRLTGASLTYAAAGAAPLALDNFDLTLDWPARQAPTDVTLVLRPAGDPVEVKARLRGLDGLLDGQVTPATAQITAPGGVAGFDGRLSMAGEAAGAVTLNTTDTGRMLAALGLAGAQPPQGLGRAVDLATNITYTADGRLSLRDLSARLDQNRVTGSADVVLSSPPAITAQFTAGDLDFSQAAGSTGGGGAATASGSSSGWSTDPIDASALSLFNGNIRFSAQSLNTGGLRTGPIAGALTIDRARAVLDIDRVSVFDGTVAGQLIANNRSGLSVGGKVRATEIELQKALSELAGLTRLAGKGQGELEFLGVGNSVQAIMSSLSGTGAISAGPGVIHGIDLDRLMQTGSGSGGTTVFNTLTASYTITGGNLQNSDLLLMLKNFRADGQGRIGLGARDIDYLFTPVALRANSGKGIAIPVRIRGPWASPSIVPDLSKALEGEIEIKKDELEQQAKEKALEKLSEELEVPVESQQDAEEALKDKLEEEAKKGLLKLLGQN